MEYIKVKVLAPFDIGNKVMAKVDTIEEVELNRGLLLISLGAAEEVKAKKAPKKKKAK